MYVWVEALLWVEMLWTFIEEWEEVQCLMYLRTMWCVQHKLALTEKSMIAAGSISTESNLVPF